jgi:hypothetical protein
VTVRRGKGARRSVWARAAVPLALACLVLQLASAAHIILSPHSICAEHGDVVEGAAPHGGARALPVQRSGLLSSRAPPVVVAGHDHDHCLLASHRRDGLPTSREAVRVPVPLRSSHACAAAQHVLARAPIDIILVAPKSSPPSALAV